MGEPAFYNIIRFKQSFGCASNSKGLVAMPDVTNYKGEKIKCVPEFRKPEYWSGKVDSFNRKIPAWDLLIDADEYGFDKRHVEPNGHWKMEVDLPKHTRLIRYGYENGFFTAPKGTRFEELSLPYKKESLYYHEYEVIADSIRVTCYVDRGLAAPGFACPGGGIQYHHPYNMIKSINLSLLKEIL